MIEWDESHSEFVSEDRGDGSRIVWEEKMACVVTGNIIKTLPWPLCCMEAVDTIAGGMWAYLHELAIVPVAIYLY